MAKKALIVDDNLTNIDVLRMLLESQGVEAVAVSSPRHIDEAIASVDAVDVVFLDLEIPNYNGFAVLQDLKKDSRLKAAPIVAYTVHTSEIDTARKAGFNSFLGKPLSVQRFPDQLARILNGEGVWEI
jgi:two-component system cell cycle response regulator DivK